MTPTAVLAPSSVVMRAARGSVGRIHAARRGLAERLRPAPRARAA